MKQLIVIVEGVSEERFVMRTLKPHLSHPDVRAIKPVTGTRRDGSRARGGGNWKKWLAEIRLALSSKNRELRVTTMFDLYGLPPDFPGLLARGEHANTAHLADALQHAMAAAVGDPRFVPYVMRHEFETLVLAALSELHDLVKPRLRAGLAPLRKLLLRTPVEDVNCGKRTAPSKRLEAAGIDYEKLLHGVLAVQRAGIAKLRSACPRFDAWVRKLEEL